MIFELQKTRFDLKVNWKLSRNSTTFKENYIVKLQTNSGEFFSEIAPNIRYGETPENIQEQFNAWLNTVELKKITDIATLTEALDGSKLFHSLRFGLESALLSYLAREQNKSLESFLHLKTAKNVETSFSMPIIPVNEIEDYLKPLARFKSLKIKVNQESAQDMISEITKHTDVKLRVDANEGWKDLDGFIKFHDSLKGKNIELIEQPFPSVMQAEYKELKKYSKYTLLADESIEDVGNFADLSQQFHAVNIKLMKTGSLIKAKELMDQARLHKMNVMIGCMIESSIGIKYGMLYSGLADYVDLDGHLLIKDEPYGLVPEENGYLNLI